ncbi:MAG: methylated-DNA--[protein]-cysteine S-methyltransferase [Bacteroidia bacterium]|nr:methylated-DNA--[protein]-cysteine S-methyltransferase [Bacteroidia bacterium]
MKKTIPNTPIGTISIICHKEDLIRLSFDNGLEDETNDTPILNSVATQIEEYFSKKREVFNVPLSLIGTDLQLTVWRELQSVPYGSTISYSDFAAQLKLPHAVRAVANAIAKNPIPVVIPCHRVCGKNGNIQGYIGGISRKKWLLDLEAGQQSLFDV